LKRAADSFLSFLLDRPFPGKKPLRSLFGLSDAVKEERRRELEQWLGAAVAVSVVQPWVRRHLHAFLQVPPSARAPLAAATSNQIQVQMPHGVSPGEMLEIEVRRCFLFDVGPLKTGLFQMVLFGLRSTTVIPSLPRAALGRFVL
jgi:hypothetical protein